jgi:hypothetical protein
MPPEVEELEELEEVEEQAEEETPESIAAAKAAADKAKPDAKEDAARELREENKALRQRAAEAEDNAKFWHGKAKDGGGGKGTPKAEPTEEESAAFSEDIVDALASGDKKRVAKLMGEMGFVRKDDVDQAISRTRAQIGEESKLYGKYPDLQDTSSEFFKLASEKYNELAADPILAKSGKLIEIAARLAEAELGGGTGSRKAGRSSDAEEEVERVRRVGSQSGDRGRKPAGKAPDNSDLSPQQASIIAKFKAAGSSLSEDGYRARANKGVNMAGRRR